MGPTATRLITVKRRSRRYRNRWQWLLVERGVTEVRGIHSFTPKSILNSSIAGFEWNTAYTVLDLAHCTVFVLLGYENRSEQALAAGPAT